MSSPFRYVDAGLALMLLNVNPCDHCYGKAKERIVARDRAMPRESTYGLVAVCRPCLEVVTIRKLAKGWGK